MCTKVFANGNLFSLSCYRYACRENKSIKSSQDKPKSGQNRNVGPKKKRKLVLESDSEFEVRVYTTLHTTISFCAEECMSYILLQMDEPETDEDHEIDVGESDDDLPKKRKPSKQVVNIVSDDEDEVIPPPKKRHAASTPAKRSMPASLVCSLFGGSDREPFLLGWTCSRSLMTATQR